MSVSVYVPRFVCVCPQIQKEATNHENQTYMMRQQLEQAKAAADAQLARCQQEADARLAAELTSACASAHDTGQY